MSGQTPPTRPPHQAMCVGQVALDLISLSPQAPLSDARFAWHAGGSAANVAAGLQYHGLSVRLVSRLGSDAPGRYVRGELERYGLSTADVTEDPERPTRVVRIGTPDAAGRVEVEPHRLRSADLHLGRAALSPARLDDIDLLHLGGSPLLTSEGFEGVLSLVRAAGARHLAVSFDPNLLPSRTPHPDLLRSRLAALLPQVDVLQCAGADLEDLWPGQTGATLAEQVPVVIVTAGAAGAHLHAAADTLFTPAAQARLVDPTGAGDAFLAAFLSCALREGTAFDAPASRYEAAAAFAAEWAARTVGHRGALTVYRRPPAAA